MNDQMHAAINRNYAILQEEADRERDRRRRAEWPEHRAELNRRHTAARRAAEDAGLPAYYGPPPEFDCPAWFVQANPEPRTYVEVPKAPAAGLAPGFDALGRRVGKIEPTAEQAFKAAEKSAWWKP